MTTDIAQLPWGRYLPWLIGGAIALEASYLGFRRRYPLRDASSSLLALGFYSTIKAVVVPVQLWLLIKVHALSPFPAWSGPGAWLAGALIVDFLHYWKHRWMHEVPLLWAFHLLHHSSPRYHLMTAVRLDWGTQLLHLPVLALPALLGFSPFLLFTVASALSLYQLWLHTELIPRLPFLDFWVNTPFVHRVHHSRDVEESRHNYGSVLMAWDRLFGTYSAAELRAGYGLEAPRGDIFYLILYGPLAAGRAIIDRLSPRERSLARF